MTVTEPHYSYNEYQSTANAATPRAKMKRPGCYTGPSIRRSGLAIPAMTPTAGSSASIGIGWVTLNVSTSLPLCAFDGRDNCSFIHCAGVRSYAKEIRRQMTNGERAVAVARILETNTPSVLGSVQQ